jgi:hypothetical protein
MACFTSVQAYHVKFPRNKWLRMAISSVAILVIVIGFASYLMYPAFKLPPPPESQRPGSQKEANEQDIAYLKYALHAVDRSFSPAERDAFVRQIDELSARAGALDAASLELGLARAVAISNNGHTNVLGAGWGLTLNSVPLRFYWFADGLYIVRADPAYSDLLGAKILAIGERTPDELSRFFRSYVGGPDSLAREFSVRFMESPEVLQSSGLQNSPSRMELTLQTLEGDIVERSVTAVPVPVTGPAPEKSELTLRFDPRELYWPRRDLSPVPLPGDAAYPQPVKDGRQWNHLLGATDTPVTLQEPNRFYWATELAGGRALFIQINVTLDEPGREPLEGFLEKILEDAAPQPPRFAILDLRSNPGGSYQKTARFVKKLPALIPDDGRIFILTSGNTFSAGIVTTARLKYYAGSRGEIVGEPMGDDPQFWAEAATRIVLPNSGLRVAYATGYHDWENGCPLSRLFRCYLPNYFLGVAAGSLEPTLPVAWSFADYRNGKDTALEAIMQIIAAAE